MVKSEKKMLKTCTLKNYKALLRGSKDRSIIVQTVFSSGGEGPPPCSCGHGRI